MSQKFQAKSFEVDKLSDESYLNEAISSYIKDGFVLIKGLAELTSQIHSVLNDVLFTTTAQRNAMSLNDLFMSLGASGWMQFHPSFRFLF